MCIKNKGVVQMDTETNKSIEVVNGLLSELYDIIQNAKSSMFSSEKCIIDRDEAISIIEEIISKLPSELKSARTIVDARNELIIQGKKEAESTLTKAKNQANEIISAAHQDATNTINNAKQQAEEMVKAENVYTEAQNRAKEMIEQAQQQIEELKRVSHEYMSKSLKESESAMEKALIDLRETRIKFEKLSKKENKTEKSKKEEYRDAHPFFQDIDL